MPQTAPTDPLVVAVVSVSLTLLAGLSVGLLTALLARRGEHAKWLRERRDEGYVAFMVDMSTMTTLINTKPSAENASKIMARIEDHSERASAAFEAVSLLGPRRVNAAGQKGVWAASEYATSKADVEESALSAARWQFLIVAGKVLKSKNVTAEPPDKSSATSRYVGGARNGRL